MTRPVVLRRRALLTGLLAVLGALAAAGCAAPGPPPTVPPVGSVRPAMTVTPAVNLTRSELVRVLGDSQAPIRPGEAPLLAAAPRAVYQVILPKDPTKGFIVVYEFPDAARAAAAAAEEQAYLATGPGRVQRPQGTVTVIRQVGSTVVFYDWLPGASLDPSAPGIQATLETLGTGYPVAN